eukprot:scaffold1954_cov268-Pinguiococcus_pyrenoidosus.AAC.10
MHPLSPTTLLRKGESRIILQEWHQPTYLHENEELLLQHSKEHALQQNGQTGVIPSADREHESAEAPLVPADESEVVATLKRNMVSVTEHTRFLLQQVRELRRILLLQERQLKHKDWQLKCLRDEDRGPSGTSPDGAQPNVPGASLGHEPSPDTDSRKLLGQELEDARKAAENVRTNNRRLVETLRLRGTQIEAAQHRASTAEKQAQDTAGSLKILQGRYGALERQMLQMQETEAEHIKQLQTCQEDRLLLKIELQDLKKRAKLPKRLDDDSLASLMKVGDSLEPLQHVKSLYEGRIKAALDESSQLREEVGRMEEERRRAALQTRQMECQLQLRAEVIEKLERRIAELSKAPRAAKRSEKTTLLESEKLKKTLQEKESQLCEASDKLLLLEEERDRLESEFSALQSEMHARELLHRDEISKANTFLKDRNLALADMESAFQQHRDRAAAEKEVAKQSEAARQRRHTFEKLTRREMQHGDRIRVLESKIANLKVMLETWQARALDLASRAREEAERELQMKETPDRKE